MKKPFLLAPMAELSHRALRELIERYSSAYPNADSLPLYCGCDEYYSEMLSAGALLSGGPFERWYLDTGPRPQALVFQLEGRDEGQLADAAEYLSRFDCAGIDINMGCSAPAIVRCGAGVAWMASIEKAASLIKQVRKRTKRRLSVKLRTGFTDDFEYLVRFCRALEAEGVQRITLHARTAKEKFKRQSRWDYIEALAQALHIPVAGNGDIADAAELAAKAASPASFKALMVGRAAVRSPWVFARARVLEAGLALPASLQTIDLEEGALVFLDLLARFQPVEFHKSRAQRFFSYYVDNFMWAHYVKTRLNREPSLAGMERVLREYIQHNPDEKYMVP
ncbi:tRNA dihydrouridine synthase [Breznakiellaceae bacterium SP9]